MFLHHIDLYSPSRILLKKIFYLSTQFHTLQWNNFIHNLIWSCISLCQSISCTFLVFDASSCSKYSLIILRDTFNNFCTPSNICLLLLSSLSYMCIAFTYTALYFCHFFEHYILTLGFLYDN